MGDEERPFEERPQPARDCKERTHPSGSEEREGRSSQQGDYGQGGYWEAEGSGHEPRGCGGQADNEQTGTGPEQRWAQSDQPGSPKSRQESGEP
jgi:hypothetical protein